MNKINTAAIKRLLELEDDKTLSIYVPTHRFPTSEHIQEDKIRFKNLVRKGKELLEKNGADEGLVRAMTSELDDIHDNDAFWQDATEGIAVFCSPAGVRFFHLPFECEEYVNAGDRYDISPLLVAASYDSSYYLLALAARHPVLFRGDMYGIEAVDIELPESPEQALQLDELYSNSQTVRAGSYGAGNPGAKSHGQGDSRQAGQEERLKFFRIIDETLLSSNSIDSGIPVLLAGTDDDISNYREISRLKHILKSHLGGNYTEMNPAELHARSWPLVHAEIGQKTRSHVIEKLGNLLGTGKSSAEIGDITRAAKEGRVDTLLLGMLAVTRDTISDGEAKAVKLVFPEHYNPGSVADIVRTVFDQGGAVIGIIKDDMLGGTSEAAVYRY